MPPSRDASSGLKVSEPRQHRSHSITQDGAYDKPICWKSGLEPDTGRAPWVVVSNLRISHGSGNHDRS